MILDSLTHSSTYFDMGSGLVIALQYLRQTDLNALPAGRRAIDGDRVFALVSEYETKPEETRRWEAHRRHIDVQYVQSGEERVGYADLSAMKRGPYDHENDVVFAEGDGDFLTLQPGRFVVLFPQDAHMPGVSLGPPRHVKKVVVKLHVP